MRNEKGQFVKGSKDHDMSGLIFGFHGKHTVESKLKMSLAKKGRISTFKGKKHSIESRAKMQLARIGKKLTEEHKRNIGLATLGYKHTEEAKERISETHKGKPHPWSKGENNNNWKGGITPINEKIRKSNEYKDWRIAVFKRDNFTCQGCGGKGITLNADHIKPFAYYPELRLVIENGRTLCVACHKKTDTYGRKVYIYQKNFNNNL